MKCRTLGWLNCVSSVPWPLPGRMTFSFVGFRQRIYKSRTSLLSCGLDVRGRSTQLKINHRTTQQIRRFADALFAPSEADADGDPLTPDAVSILNGPVPRVAAFRSIADEISGLAEWLESRLSEGVK